MNVLHVTASMDPKNGGVSKAVEMIITGFEEHGILNEVVSLDAPNAAYIKNFLFPVHALGPGKSPWNYSSALVPWLQTNYSRIDIIIIHGLWLYSSFSVGKALHPFRHKSLFNNKGNPPIPKVFVMPHGMLDPYFQRAAGRKLKAYRNWAYWKLIEQNTVNNADGLLFTCEEEKRLARQPFKPYIPKKELVVGLGIENPPAYTDVMQKAFSEKCSSIHHQHYILFIGRIHEKKGVDLLINAYAKTYADLLIKEQLKEEFTNDEVNSNIPRLIIAGPGIETSYGQQVLKLVEENNILKRSVYFTGMLTGNAKWGAFYGCEAFILPSHQENFGIAVVEALACSKPVLISNQVNIWREIEDAGGGIVADDTLEGTKLILQSWRGLSFEEKKSMGRKAQQCYQNSFSIHSAANKMLAAITS